MDERNRVQLLTLDRIKDGEINSQGESSLFGTIAENDFAKDGRMTKGLFGMIVGGRHSRDFQEGKEAVKIPFRIEKSLAKILCFRVMKSFFTEMEKAIAKRRDPRFGLSKGNVSQVAKATDFTGVFEESFDLSAKPKIMRKLLGLG